MSVFQKIYQQSVTALQLKHDTDNLNTKNVLSEIFGGIVLNSFVWENLPDNTFFDRPELYLYYNGTLAAFDNNGKIDIYPTFPNGSLRPDGFNESYTIITLDGHSYIRKFEEIALCQNNSSKIPNYVIVDNFIDRLFNAIRAVDVQLYKSIMGDILSCPNETAIDVITNAYNKSVDNHLPFICVNGSSFVGSEIVKTSLFDNKITDIISIWDIYDKYKHEFLTYYGINNTETEKKERLITDEVNSNNEVIQCGYYGHLFRHREEFAKRYNKLFGQNLIIKKNREEVEEKENANTKTDENSRFGSGDNTQNNT